MAQQEVGRFVDLLSKITIFPPLAAPATNPKNRGTKLFLDIDVAMILDTKRT